MRLLGTLAVVLLVAGPGGTVRADGVADGLVAFEAGDYARAMAIWQPLAEAGDVEAQFRLGDMYRFGTGTEKNADLALDWLGRAAAQGHVSALTSLGYMYNHGKAVEEDDDKAECLYRAAAERGYANAQWNLSGLYRDKWKLGRAKHWYNRAVAQGQPESLSFRGRVYLSNPFRPDKTEAYMYLLLAEMQGEALAVEALARVRRSTDPTVQDWFRVAESKARHWQAVPEIPPDDPPPVSPACLPR